MFFYQFFFTSFLNIDLEKETEFRCGKIYCKKIGLDLKNQIIPVEKGKPNTNCFIKCITIYLRKNNSKQINK